MGQFILEMDKYGEIGASKTAILFKLQKILITTFQLVFVELGLDSSVAGLISSVQKLIPVLFSSRF